MNPRTRLFLAFIPLLTLSAISVLGTSSGSSGDTPTSASSSSSQGRFWRGRPNNPDYQTLVVPADSQKGIALVSMGNNASLFGTNLPWCVRTSKSTAYHANGDYSTNGYIAKYPVTFENPIVAFGREEGGSSLYINQPCHVGLSCGSVIEGATNDFQIVVYRKSDFSAGQTNVAPFKTYSFTIPKKGNAAAWASISTNNFAFQADVDGLKTTVQYIPSHYAGDKYGNTGGVTNVVFSASGTPFLITHIASSTNYYYTVKIMGQFANYVNNSVLMPMVVTNTANPTATAVLSPAYTLDFEQRPSWRSVYIDQPQFNGTPMPPMYAGKSTNELLHISSPVTNQFVVTPSSYLTLDNSPELRRHPILDKFVADMGNDPIGLINYVLNEVEITDTLAYNDAGELDEESINLGGMNRGALATFIEGQGSPMEQCALLVYLLRKAGVPAGYVFAPHNSLQMLDARMSQVLRLQIKGAVNYLGGAASPQIIPVNYPWVAAYINGKWVHIFPWMKDTEIKEGLDFYDYMPEGYNTAYKWVKKFLNNDPAIMSLSNESDVPRVLLPRFIEKTLKENHPEIAPEELGIHFLNRKNYFTRLEDFPQPWALAFSSTPLSLLDNLSSKPELFNTIRIDVSSIQNPGRAVTSGEVRVMDVHNRRILVRFEKTRSNPNPIYTWHNMILSMEAFRPDATGSGSFSDPDLIAKQSQASELWPGEDRYIRVAITYRRHRSLPSNFAAPVYPYLGLYEWLELKDEKHIQKGDLAAICFDFGRITQKMLDVHAEQFWRDQQLQTSDPETSLGTTTLIMGSSFHQKLNQWDDALLSLHHRQYVSRFNWGLANLFAVRYAPGSGQLTGELPNGEIHYKSSGVDMLYGELAFTDNRLIHQDSNNSSAIPDISYLTLFIAGASAEEHNAIQTFFPDSDAVSTVKLLQLANQSGRPMVELNQTNYQTQGNVSYSFESQTSALKDWDPTMWTSIIGIFENEPFVSGQYGVAFLTPGSVKGAKSNYKGMGGLAINKWGSGSYGAALITGNMNGGWGSNFDQYLDQSGWSDFDLRLDFNGYELDYMQSTFSDPDLTSSLLSPRSISSVLNEIANQTSWVDDMTFRSLQETSILLGLGPVTSNTGQGTSDIYREIENRGSISGTSWWGNPVDKVSDPVHSVTGEFYVDSTDLALNGPMPMTIRRNYGSQNLTDNDFGYGWKLAYFPYLSISTDNALIYAAEMNGSVIAYRQQSANPSLWLPTTADNPQLSNVNGDVAGSAGNMFNAKIVRSVSGTQTLYTLTGPDGGVRTFEVRSYPTPGPNVVSRQRPYIKKWRDSRGNFYDFTFGEDPLSPDYGLLVRIAASNGNFIGFNHDTFGHIIEAFTGDGRRISYEYDLYGDLVKVTLPDGTSMGYEYKHNSQMVNAEQKFYSEHLILRELKPEGRILENIYDAKRRVTQQSATVGQDMVPVRNATFEYFNNDTGSTTNLITGYTLIHDAYDTPTTPRITRYDYDKGQITKITDALGQAVVQEWYQPGDVTAGAYPRSIKKRTDKRGFISEFQYDVKGNLTQIKQTGDVTGDGVADTPTRTFAYNSLNMVTQQVDAVGNKVITAYGNASYPYLPTSVEKRTSSGSVSTTTYQYVNVTSNGFSSFGLLQQQTRAVGTADEAITSYTYGASGFPTSVIKATGTTDPAIVLNFKYNLRGELVEEADAIGRKCAYAYDARGNRIWEERFNETGARVSWLYNYYNHNGEIEWTDGPRYNPEDYVWHKYDGAGRIKEETRWRSEANASGTGVEAPSDIDDLYATTFYTHDLFGNLTEIRDAGHNSTVMTYDKIGQMLTRKSYQGSAQAGIVLKTESYGYEAGGSVSAVTNALGGVTKKLYTANGLLKQQTNPDGTVLKWTYLLDGRLNQEFLSTGAHVDRTYNDLSRIVTKTLKTAGGSVLSTTSTAFDRRGNITSSTDEEGFTTTFAYDDLDRIKMKTGPVTGSSAQQIVRYTYDNSGKTLQVANGLNETTTTTYDAVNRPVLIQMKDASSAVIRQISYSYSVDGNRVTTTTGSGTYISGSYVPITTTSYTDTSNNQVLEIQAGTGPYNHLFFSVYDNMGNLISSQEKFAISMILAFPPISISTTSYSYDGLNRMKTQVLPDGVTTTFSYDAAGNLLTRAMPGGLVWQATYDNASRKKAEKLVNGTSTTRSSTYAYYTTGANIGLLQSITDPRGIVHTTTYDSFLRPQTIQSTGTTSDPLTTLAYVYDRRGVVQQIDQTYANAPWLPPVTLKRAYDGYRQITNETILINGVVSRSMAQAWYADGRRSGLTDLDSTLPAPTFGFTSRADGIVTRVSANRQNYDFVYADSGLIVSSTTPWANRSFTHERPGRLNGQTTYVGGAIAASEIFSLGMDFRPSYHMASYFQVGSGNKPPLSSSTESYTFNSRNQLLTENLPVTFNSTGILNYTLTPLNMRSAAKIGTGAPTNWENVATTINAFSQVTAEKTKPRAFLSMGLAKGAGSVDFAVDGQPLSPTKFGGFQSNGIWSASLDLPSGQHSLSVTAKHPSGKFSVSTNTTFTVAATVIGSTYDAEGNVRTRTLEDGIVQTLTWDGRGRLVKLVHRDASGNGYDWTAIYDPLGRRLRTIEQPILANAASGATTTLDSWYDPQVEFLETAVAVNGQRTLKVHGPDSNERYGGLQGIGGLQATIRESDRKTVGLLHDMLGNVMACSTGTNVTWKSTLMGSYGPVPHAQIPLLSATTELATASVWHGKHIDRTGLYYLGARYYDSNAGRFLSPDPFGHSSSMSLYNYANGNPVAFMDPDGRVGKGAFAAGVDMLGSMGNLAMNTAGSVGYSFYSMMGQNDFAEAMYGDEWRGLGTTAQGMIHFGSAVFNHDWDTVWMGLSGGEDRSGAFRTGYAAFNFLTLFGGEALGNLGKAGELDLGMLANQRGSVRIGGGSFFESFIKSYEGFREKFILENNAPASRGLIKGAYNPERGTVAFGVDHAAALKTLRDAHPSSAARAGEQFSAFTFYQDGRLRDIVADSSIGTMIEGRVMSEGPGFQILGDAERAARELIENPRGGMGVGNQLSRRAISDMAKEAWGE